MGYNIAGPAQNQLQNMSTKQRSVATGLGLGAASMLLAQQVPDVTDSIHSCSNWKKGVCSVLCSALIARPCSLFTLKEVLEGGVMEILANAIESWQSAISCQIGKLS